VSETSWIPRHTPSSKTFSTATHRFARIGDGYLQGREGWQRPWQLRVVLPSRRRSATSGAAGFGAPSGLKLAGMRSPTSLCEMLRSCRGTFRPHPLNRDVRDTKSATSRRGVFRVAEEQIKKGPSLGIEGP